MSSRSRKAAAETEMVIASSQGVPLARIPGSIREQVRYLWTRLQVQGSDVPNSIAVTSQISGEGVSFTCRALAAVLGRARPTCIVEANWWSEGIPARVDNPGLAGLLGNTCTIADVLVPTSHPGLSIVPAGELTEAGQAVMASSVALRDVIEQLHAAGFAYVVLDLPAITTSATALSFAAAAEASILVVRQRVTHIDQAVQAAEDLRHTRLLGIILNGNQLSMPRFLQRRLLKV